MISSILAVSGALSGGLGWCIWFAEPVVFFLKLILAPDPALEHLT
jgi:hypothetical protein